MRQFLFLVLVGSGCLLPRQALAQAERFEMGRHLRAFEIDWQQQNDVQARRRAIPHLQQATRIFLVQLGPSRLAEASRSLDQARFALRSADNPPAAVQWAESLFWNPERRLIDTSAAELAIGLRPFYSVKADPPKTARWRLTLLTDAGKPLASAEAAIAKLPLQAQLPLKDIPEGDHRLRGEILVNDKVVVQSEQILACIARLAPRLEALQQAVAALPASRGDTQKETVRGLVRVLARLANKEYLENNCPAARLLVEAEAALPVVARGEPFYGRNKTGDFWLTLALNPKDVPARLAVPAAAVKGQPVPLVIVVHGTGGSENIFFDAHGPGKLVRLCRERGWLLVAPQSSFLAAPPLDQVIAAVDRLYPVDKQRVFLVGHSIGGAHVVKAAKEKPQLFAGVAALGPAQATGQATEALQKVPFCIRLGSEEFMLQPARELRDELQKVGAPVDYREYPNVEHLGVVVESLEDVMRFFDQAAKRPGN